MIPFYRPFAAPRQEEYLLDALKQGPLSGDGRYSQQVLALLAEKLGFGQALLTPSASHALELAFWELEPGDEVILPAYNFPSAGNAVLRGGGRVVLCDIDPHTQNLDPRQAEAWVTPRTRAICLTHYAGIPCDMDAFSHLAGERGLLLVEDAAQALGSRYQGRPLGGIGEMGCFSFHATKNISCGEGGVFLQRGNPEAFARARTRRDKGTNRHAFLKGTAAFYCWEETGSSHLLSDLSAALLLAQLEEMDRVNARRLLLCREYHRRLRPAFEAGALLPMGLPPYAQGNGHIYYVRCPSPQGRDRLREALARKGIDARPHFVPLHLGSMGRRLGYRKGQFPHSENTAQTLLRLPLFESLTEGEVDQVCRAVLEAVQ